MTLMELIDDLVDWAVAKGDHPTTVEARSAVVEAVEKLERDAMRYQYLFGCEYLGDNYRKCWQAWDGEDGLDGFNRVVDAAMEKHNG